MMDTKNISKTLKKYRKKNLLSVENVVELLHKRGITISKKTIYGWESGHATPRLSVFLELCEIYHITNVLAAFSSLDNDSSFHVTNSEYTLIKAYRKHPEMQKAVNKLLGLKVIPKKKETDKAHE